MYSRGSRPETFGYTVGDVMELHGMTMRGQKARPRSILLRLAVLLCISFAAFTARAQETATTTATNSPEIAPPVIEAVAAMPRGVLSSENQRRITNLAANISNRMDAAVERFDQISERISSRMQKLGFENFNTLDAQQKHDESQQSLDAARSLLADIDTDVSLMVTGETPWDNWQDLKSTYRTVHSYLRNTHRTLEETVTLLQNSVPTAAVVESDTATSTDE